MIINSFHTSNIHTINIIVKRKNTAIHPLTKVRGFLTGGVKCHLRRAM